MVAGIVLSTWLGVWIFGKIFSILRDCFKLSLVLLLILAYFFYSPDALASVNGFVNTYARRHNMPTQFDAVTVPLKQSLRYSALFIADRLYDLAAYLK